MPRLALGLLLLAACGRVEPAARVPQRIVALAPSNVEILFALGLGGRVVGVGNYCTYPPETSSRPQLGGLFDPNLEALVALRPDLVVLAVSERDLAAKVAGLGIPSLVVGSDGVREIAAAIPTIADRCGVAEAGHGLLARFEHDLAPLPPRPGPPPRVLVTFERSPGRIAEVLAAGPGSYPAELLARAGVVNVVADAPSAYPKLSLETILARKPDFILELSGEEPSQELTERLLADWQAYPEIPAVAAGRVRILAGSHTLVPGPRLPLLYRQLQEALGLDRGTAR